MENIIFNKEKHQYSIDNRIIPSVNQIINKVFGNNFATDNIYIRQARDKGTLIHKVIEEYVNCDKEPDIPMIEFDNFLKISNKKKLFWNMSEKIIYNNIDGYEYAGTLDLYDTQSNILADIKTGSTKNLKKWQIQLSMYAYAIFDNYNSITEQPKIVILHLHNEINKYIELKILSREEIVKILKQYYEEEKQEQEDQTLMCLDKTAISKLNAGLDAIEKLEIEIKEFKEKIREEMEQRGIFQIKIGKRTISYISPTTRESIDTKTIKSKYPEIYDKCKKIVNVNSTVRIK